MKKFTTRELKCFSKKNHTIIADIFIEGIIEHNRKKGIVSIEMDKSGDLTGLCYNVIDRRKLKFTNISLQNSERKNVIPIYWQIIREGEQAAAVKELFDLPLVGQYYSLR